VEKDYSGRRVPTDQISQQLLNFPGTRTITHPTITNPTAFLAVPALPLIK